MIQNPGFIFEIKDSNSKGNGFTLTNFVNRLPKEYGPQIIKHAHQNWNWLYFLPQEENKLLLSLFFDDGENVILFYGSIYNDAIINNIDLLKEELLRIIKESSHTALINFLNSLSGYYCGVVGNIVENNFIAFTDRFGIGKLFYHSENGKRIFATNLFLMKEYLGEKAELSDFAASSILFCGHTFTNQSIIKDVKQILPGHYIRFQIDSNELHEYDYAKYPERKDLNLSQSVEQIANAHKNFWNKLDNFVENDVALLLSRGKDCRVILKYMLADNLVPDIITYFREKNELYPFVSFLLDTKEDSLIAERICLINELSYNKIKIDNIAFLENLSDILLLNNGSPSHWEIFEAAKAASVRSKYLVSGFMGDPYAGKGKHHYIFGSIRNNIEYGKFTFNKASDIDSYSRVSDILRKNGILNLNPTEDLSVGWIRQYQSVDSEDMDVVGAEGLLRTRGIGRVIPTFQQSRSYAIPVYPYLDLEILNSYLTIPAKYLKGEIAHLMQISNDKKFNQFPTTRLPIDAKKEKRQLKLLAVLRKLDYVKSDFKKRKEIVSLNAHSYNVALRKTLQDMNILSERFIDDLLPANAAHTNEYYNIVANFISMMRIQSVYFNNKVETRNDLKISDYKNEYMTQKKQNHSNSVVLERWLSQESSIKFKG